jgi:predicted ferric reductase
VSVTAERVETDPGSEAMTTGAVGRAATEPSAMPARAVRNRAARGNVVPFLMVAAVVANVLAITLGWVQHGGWPPDFGTASLFTAIGQITALLGTFAALVQILLVARVPGLDGRFGMDRLVRWHRVVGFSLVVGLVLHVVATSIGWAAGDGRAFVAEFIGLNQDHSSVILASIATVLLGLVAVSSMRFARKSLSREAWFFIHLLSYLMVGLSFPHIVQVGSDFDHHRWTTYYWVAMYGFVIAAVLWHRLGNPIRNHRRHRFTLSDARIEAPGVVSLRVTGSKFDRFNVRPGQFVTLRFLHDSWRHRAHPYSISGIDAASFRVTVKALGDDSARVGAIAKGTKVIVEGPYGAFTDRARVERKVLLIAGGIGITPIRMLFEHLPGDSGDVTLLYRASSANDVVFRRELDAIARAKGHRIHYVVGARDSHPELFDADTLRALVPDIATHDVYLCGPTEMVKAAVAGLRRAGVPRRRIHAEDFSL